MSAAHAAAPTPAPTDAAYPWSLSASGLAEDPEAPQDSDYQRQFPKDGTVAAHLGHGRTPLAAQNGNSVPHAFNSRLATTSPMESRSTEPSIGDAAGDVHDAKHGPTTDGGEHASSPTDSFPDLHEADRTEERGRGDGRGLRKKLKEMYGDTVGDENSKWIHRDKLARIESEELQAAGIILPRPRDRTRSRGHSVRRERDLSQDRTNGSVHENGRAPPSRKNSVLAMDGSSHVDTASPPAWDLRQPDEIATEGDACWVPGAVAAVKGLSRIPVAKASPAPIPAEHLEREKPMARKREGSPGEEDSISYPKTRQRTGSVGTTLTKAPTNGLAPAPAVRRVDSSSRKTTRKASQTKPAMGAPGRPRTRAGPSKDATASGASGQAARAPLRAGAGERELSPKPLSLSPKQMEGDPPWMVSAYKPDPRLPPDQQLLPTVARRLQQEKWEREGKFGSVYDKEFRPLTDDGFLVPPEPVVPSPSSEKGSQAQENEDEKAGGSTGDWPLRTDSAKNQQSLSLSPPTRSGSYSTMPKISDKQPPSPLHSPRMAALAQSPSQTPLSAPVVRVPEPPAEDASAPGTPPKNKGMCGACCVMM
ncbi:hypothetical protein P8C59_004018 [Phyllachora maydis]|uniref:Uncharacterized protein n=1 Tax=Phyllachora maydis TaxID=1825666 RepID=A0AAD9MDX7_9PEZI|nr:hypothetical protein P8C59_004018 [Phyllachora maydis]